jgi:hypothetical protein
MRAVSKFVKRSGDIQASGIAFSCVPHTLATRFWLLAFHGGFIHQHDGDIVFHRIDAMALHALQALGILAVFEWLFARGANQNFQQIFGNHDNGIVLKIRASLLRLSVERRAHVAAWPV